ncbi:MAG: DUF6485 family protein [Spirochaetota bacterium]
MECNIEKNKQNCNCTYEPCPRKGKCCECLTYHMSMNQMPACFFSPGAEAAYDRSIEAFISDYQSRS